MEEITHRSRRKSCFRAARERGTRKKKQTTKTKDEKTGEKYAPNASPAPDAHLIERFFQDVVVDDGIMPRPRHLNVHRQHKRVGPEVRSTAIQYFPLTGSLS